MRAVLRGRLPRKMSKNEIPAEKLAAFLDGRLSPEERSNIEAFLAEHPQARSEMIAAARLVEDVERTERVAARRWRTCGVLAGVAAAAALAVVLVPGRNAVTEPTERVATLEDGGRITLLSPSDSRAVDARGLEFRWSSPDSATFRITVADDAGRTIWTALTTESRITLPDSVELADRRRFFWYVDAVFHDGSSITSGPHGFTASAR